MHDKRKPHKIEKANLKLDRKCLLENCANCKHSICLSRKVYCGILQDKRDNIIPEYCHYFEPEPLEYKLFKRA